jgi:VanZ family protein
MAVIFAASSTPGQELPRFGGWDTVMKKGGHAAGYALLAMAYARGLANGRRATWPHLLWAAGLAGLYGLSDEFHQHFTPGRQPTLADVAIDACGALAGAGLLGVWQWRPGDARAEADEDQA